LWFLSLDIAGWFAADKTGAALPQVVLSFINKHPPFERLDINAEPNHGICIF
jgi:hypothetical protein